MLLVLITLGTGFDPCLGIRTHLISPGVALTTETDSAGQPTLTADHIAE